MASTDDKPRPSTNKVQKKDTHVHGANCSHSHSHDHEDSKEEKKEEPKIDPIKLISNKQAAIKTTLSSISIGLEQMPKTTQTNITLVKKEFTDLLSKLQQRRDTLIQQLSQIEKDKTDMLTAQVRQLETYQKQLSVSKQNIQSQSESDLKTIEKIPTDQVTPAHIILDINNALLTQKINAFGDVNNTFAPPPPIVNVNEIKAHTCKVAFAPGMGKYDGFQTPKKYIVEIAFGPKKQKEIEQKIDESALKWKKIAEREGVRFIRVKKLKPSTIYYVRVKCENEYGWSECSNAVAFKTYVLKINTKIMTSDEIQTLIDLIKQKRKKKSLEWKLLFRGSDDGFLASTFHLKCDDMPNTICVIESSHGNVFGGFTILPWKSDVGRYHVDEEAFVYIVRKKRKALKKAIIYLQYTSSQHSVVHNKYMGPVFGYGHDIYIRNKADKVEDNSCRNHTYQCSYAGELAGKEKFKVINYEVFQISHPEDDIEEEDGDVEDESSSDGDSED